MSETSKNSRNKVLMATLIGTSIEWYDFYIFGIAAALVLGPQFFPQMSPTAGLLASFATFAVGFVARPLGAAVFGHYGDRVGRKAALVTSLILMGAGTVCVGLLPNFAVIGVWAPLLLVVVRFIQGFGIGGEWGGAALMAAEFAPKGRRGFYVGWPQLGSPVGLLLANVVFLSVRGSTTAEQFADWAWRIPFLLSVVLVVVGFVIRLSLSETPIFRRAQEHGRTAKVPLLTVFRDAPRPLLLVAGSFLMNNTGFYIVTAYTLAYIKGIPSLAGATNLGLMAQILGSIALAAGVLVFSSLADRIGRKRTILPLYLSWVVWVWPMFWLINTGTLTGFVIAIAVGTFLTSGYGPLGAFMLEQFDTRVRYTGAGVGQQIGSVFGGGLGPMLAVQLNAWGGIAAVQVYVVVIALVSSACVVLLREAANRDLESLDEPGVPISSSHGNAPVASVP
jgi:MFS family permease